MEYGAAVGGCGNHICCCECQQWLRVEDTGNIALQNSQVGDIVTQGDSSARGVIIAIERNTGIAGDLDRILVKVDDCADHPFEPNKLLKINGQSTFLPTTVITTDTCGKSTIKN